MAKTETPEQVVDFSKLDSSAKLEAFKEALKTDDTLKTLDLVKEFDIKLPDPTPVDKAVKNQEEIQSKLQEYEKTRGELAELGHKFETQSQMSESEKIIYDKVEKNSQVNLSEAIDDLVKLDADSPHEIISKMSIPTEEKVIVAKAFKEMASRNSEAVKKIKDELDTAAAELKDAKLSAPQKVEDKTGKDKVDEQMSKMGMPPIKDPEQKKE